MRTRSDSWVKKVMAMFFRRLSMNGCNVGGLRIRVRQGNIKATSFADELESANRR